MIREAQQRKPPEAQSDRTQTPTRKTRATFPEEHTCPLGRCQTYLPPTSLLIAVLAQNSIFSADHLVLRLHAPRPAAVGFEGHLLALGARICQDGVLWNHPRESPT